ncbi:MAG TPA: DMT family transporter [Marinilabiliaceae bacterium]|nr:DMT family transporter [Marinilabiliaceae bacterium]
MKNIIRSTTFLAILASWLWSTAFVGVKIGLDYQSPLQFAGIRFFISGLLLFLFFGNPRRFFSEFMKSPWFILLIALFQIFIQYAFFYTGLTLVPSALAAMVVGSSPLFVAVFVHFALKNDRMTKAKLVSIVVGVIGIAIITLGRATVEIKGEYEWVGILLLIFNNISSGFSNVLVLKRSTGVSPVVLSSASLMAGGAALFLVSLPLEGLNMGPFPAEYYLSLGWLSFLSAAAFSIWFALIKRPGVKISELNVWKFLIPVSGAILSWLIITDEHPDVTSIVGMVVIGLSLVILNLFGRDAAKK